MVVMTMMYDGEVLTGGVGVDCDCDAGGDFAHSWCQ